MRQWLCDPKILCRKHLLGEHVEIHMFVGSINKGISMKKYAETGLLEFSSIEKRHEELVTEMVSRGYKHNSPLQEIKPLGDVPEIKIDKIDSLLNLLNRCEECRRNYMDINYKIAGKLNPPKFYTDIILAANILHKKQISGGHYANV